MPAQHIILQIVKVRTEQIYKSQYSEKSYSCSWIFTRHSEEDEIRGDTDRWEIKEDLSAELFKPKLVLRTEVVCPIPVTERRVFSIILDFELTTCVVQSELEREIIWTGRK